MKPRIIAQMRLRGESSPRYFCSMMTPHFLIASGATNVRVRRWIEQSASLLVGISVSLTLSFADGATPGQSQVVDLNGQQAEPLKVSGAKAVVLIFLRTDCPISNRYAPELKRLHQKFVAGGM